MHLAKRPMSQDAPCVYRDIAAKCGVEPTGATAVMGFGAQFLPFDPQRAGLRLRGLRIE